MRKHIDTPRADDAIGGGGDDIVSVLRADKVQGIDWMSVAKACAGEGRLLYWMSRVCAGIPQ